MMKNADGSGATLARTTLAGNPVPSPEYILRGHEAQINVLSFVDAEAHGGNGAHSLLLSGDADGYVAVWSLTTFRPLAFFKAHSGSVLTVSAWSSNTRLLTHGRDNKIHIYDLSSIVLAASNLSFTRNLPSIANPTALEPLYSLGTNALGYCKCSILQMNSSEALLAVPSTLEDHLVDIFHLPSTNRVHRSIGKEMFDTKTGTVMCLSLFRKSEHLHCLVAYEDGRLALFVHSGNTGSEAIIPEENQGWTKLLEMHEHKEPIMALCMDTQHQTAWSVSADHLVVRYNPFQSPQARAYKTAYPGRGAVSLRQDGRILATAGWDGLIRVHSAASFKPLAVLDYHRDSLYAICFQTRLSSSPEGREPRLSNITTPWLAAGGADARISLWKIFPQLSEGQVN
ncbi:WD40 repeat-like protein [Cystobasidium minutum MCA 4210]|uniref:WD40 repeat-like protein n=1 Tax=Cystobasidium minutum MCA 4210 TaxID=1397322 RepID=UPI0034CE4D06|eukprot:jgi/Rhomi1/164003/estExt_Genewise1Plus.C_90281